MWPFSRSRDRSRNRSEVSENVPAEEHYGLFILHDCSTGNRSVDIVAVHGLGGHWKDTWTGPSSRMWLRDFLPTQLRSAGVGARVMSYGYNSDTAFSKAVTNIDDEAEMLLDRLIGERQSPEEKSRPLLFIAHSLGGIVVKKAIIRAHERSSIYGLLLQNIRATIFFGVPHRGSDLAYWATFLATLLRYSQVGFGANTTYVTDLQRNSETFRTISGQFIERAVQLNIRTFFETEKMGNQLIVDKESAKLGLPNEIAVGIAGSNHRTMCKFDSADSQKYRPVWMAVRALAGSAIESQRHEHQPASREDDRSLLLVDGHVNTSQNNPSATSLHHSSSSPSRGESGPAKSLAPDPSKALCDALSNGDMGRATSIFDSEITSPAALLCKIPESGASGYLTRWLDEWGVESGTISREMTALHYAVEITGPFASDFLGRVIQKILQIGPSILDILGSAHTVPTMNASRRAHSNRMEFSRGDGLDPSTPLNYNPLAWAAILDNYDAVDQLIKAGASVNSRDNGTGHTALTAQSIVSPRQGHDLQSTRLLLEGGAVYDLFSQGPKILRNALILRNWSLAKVLIRAGSPVDCADPHDSKRYTPLHLCALFGRDPNALEIRSMLLSTGARPDDRDADGLTPDDIYLETAGTRLGLDDVQARRR